MTRALVVILLITCATAAQAGSWHRWNRAWWQQDGRTFGVTAWACDRMSGRCVRAVRYFTNPVWR